MTADAATLEALVRDCAATGVVRRVLLLRLAGLPPEISQPHHLRLIAEALEPLTAADRARVFQLAGGSIAIAWRGEAAGALGTVRSTLRCLLADAPSGVRADDLLQRFELPGEGDLLLRACAEDVILRSPGGPADPVGEPLDPAALARLEAALAQASVARFVRRRSVLRLTADGLAPAWEKRVLSVAEIAAALAPGRALRADPWLFRRLTRTLDRRMLALLAAPGEMAESGPFALDLNSGSMLSPEFLRFDAALPAELRGRVVLGLLPADILSDPAAFLFARDFARARGYPLLLRGITADLLPVMTPRRLELDYLQLCWSPELQDLPQSVLEAAAEPSRIVLSRIEGPAALAWARARGLGFLQMTTAGRS